MVWLTDLNHLWYYLAFKGLISRTCFNTALKFDPSSFSRFSELLYVVFRGLLQCPKAKNLTTPVGVSSAFLTFRVLCSHLLISASFLNKLSCFESQTRDLCFNSSIRFAFSLDAVGFKTGSAYRIECRMGKKKPQHVHIMCSWRLYYSYWYQYLKHFTTIPSMAFPSAFQSLTLLECDMGYLPDACTEAHWSYWRRLCLY